MNHEKLYAYLYFIGFGGFFLASTVLEFVSFRGDGYLLVGLLGAFAIGAVGMSRATWSKTASAKVESIVSATDDILIEYVEGLYSVGLHQSTFVWWTTPPVLYIDATRREMPTFRAYQVWFHKLLLRVLRTRSTARRYALLSLFGILFSIGVLHGWWVLHHASGGVG